MEYMGQEGTHNGHPSWCKLPCSLKAESEVTSHKKHASGKSLTLATP